MGAVPEHDIGAGVDHPMGKGVDVASLFAEEYFRAPGHPGRPRALGAAMEGYHGDICFGGQRAHHPRRSGNVGQPQQPRIMPEGNQPDRGAVL